MRIQVEIRVELGGALKMNKRCLINSDPASFRMRHLRDNRACGNAQLKMGVKSSRMIKYIQELTKEVKVKRLPRRSSCKFD